MNSSASDTKDFNDACTQFVDDQHAFERFKQNVSFNRIVEHLGFEEGKVYLDYVKFYHPTLIEYFDKFKTNDSLGNPVTHNYGDIGNVSPTTIRYVYILSKLIESFGSLDYMNIVEIGAGYGGQCKIIYDIFKPNSYTIIDIGPACNLQRKYLSQFGIFPVFSVYPLIPEIESDLVISNWAFTECNKEIRALYANKIFDKAKRFFICANYYDGFENKELKGIAKIEQYPLQGYKVAILIK